MTKPSPEYHLQRYHAHRKWARYHGIIFLGGVLTIVGIFLSWPFAIRAYQHRKKANEHEAAADQELSPNAAMERELRDDPEHPVPCPECGEEIGIAWEECSFCGTTRMTSKRRNRFLALYLPLISLTAGYVLAYILSPGPIINPWTMLVVIVFLYVGGAAWVWAQYSEELEHVEQHQG